MSSDIQEQGYIEEQIVEMLLSIWRGIDNDFKSQYSRKIWQIFENNIYVASNQTASLAVFVSNVCRKLNSTMAVNGANYQMVVDLLESGHDRAVLRQIREEISYLILLLRVKLEDMKPMKPLEDMKHEN